MFSVLNSDLRCAWMQAQNRINILLSIWEYGSSFNSLLPVPHKKQGTPCPKDYTNDDQGATGEV